MMTSMEKSPCGPTPYLEVLRDNLSDLKDPRLYYKVTYKLEEVLFLVYCSSVCGLRGYEEIQDFGEERIEWLRKYLPYEDGIPSHDTINRIMGLLDTAELEALLVGLANHEIVLPCGSVVNIDGKWLSRSATAKQQQTKKSEGGKQASIVVNAYSAAHRACLASLEVGSKQGEKQAVDTLLELLDLSGCLLTMDAGYCFKDTAALVRSHGAHYFMGLKGNQPKLHGLAKELFSGNGASSEFESRDKGHNRVEKRRCKVIELSAETLGREAAKGWEGLSCLVQVERWVHDLTKDERFEECRHFITSCPMSATKAAEVARGHWQIENSLHWKLDVCMGEDESTKRSANSAVNFSVFRKLGLNKLQNWDGGTSKKISIKRKQNKCMANTKKLETVLGFV